MTPASTVLYLDYTNAIGLGGAQRSLSLLIRHLDRSQYRPVVGCSADEQLRELLPSEVDVRDLVLPASFRTVSRYESPWGRLPKLLTASAKAVTMVKQMIAQERPSVIHANNLKMLWLASRAARGTVPVIWHVRDIYPDSTFARACLRMGSAMASHVVTVSNAVRRQFTESENVSVIYNAVELPDIEAATLAGRNFRTVNGIPAGSMVAGFAGRLAKWKGVDLLITAIADLKNRFSNLHLLIVGDGPERQNLETLALRHAAEDRVHFVPFQEQIGPVFGAMDFVVVPSVEPDPFPRSVIEAMSYGKAVIGSRDGGIVEAVCEGKTGYLVQPESVTELGRALEQLAGHPDRTAAMGLAGRARCEEFFSVGQQAKTIAALYNKLTRSTSRIAA